MSRLSEALRNLKLGADELALRSHLRLERAKALLRGDEASPAELRAISIGLRVPLSLLATGKIYKDDESEISLLFRKARLNSEIVDLTIDRVASFVESALRVLPQRVALPAWLDSFEAKTETYAEAARLALQFRHQFVPEKMDDPLNNLPKLLETFDGLIIHQLKFSKYEGVSLIAGNYCFVFISPRFSGRMLFTLAHELGHLIAHHRGTYDPIFESASKIGSKRNISVRESFVDAFASNLLLPDAGLAKAIKKIKEIYNNPLDVVSDLEILLVARYFGLSFDVVARRCEELEILPMGGAYALSNQLKHTYSSPEKAADKLGLPARPVIQISNVAPVLGAAIARKIENGEISIGWAADQFGLSISEILGANITLRPA